MDLRKHAFTYLKKRAFTIIELIIVLATIGILFIALAPRMDSASSKAKVASVQADFRGFYAAAQQVALEVPNPEDLSMEEFEMHLNSFLDSSKQFENRESLKEDPWSNSYRYTTTLLNNKFCIIFASQGDDEIYRFKLSDMADAEAAGDDEFIPRITLAFAIANGEILSLDPSETEAMEDRVSNLEHPIASTLSNQTVVEGSEFTFTVILNNTTGDISYQWYKDGSAITGQASNELTMTADLAYDGSRFMCEVTKNGNTYQTNTATLEVIPNSMISLSIESMPAKTYYYESQNFASEGLTLKASYSNGSSTIIDNFIIQNGTNLAADQTSVQAVWGDYIVEVPITVVSKTAIGITIISLPTKVSYVETQDFDPTGMIVAVEYNNGTKETITGYNITGGSKLKVGTQTITVKYDEFTSSFTVNVVKLQVIKLEVTNPPTKTRYLEGENFEAAGMVVKATWNNGSSKNVNNTSGTTSNGSGYTPITNGYTIADGNNLRADQSSVTLKMDSATATVPIIGNNIANYTVKHWQQNLSGDADAHNSYNYTVKDIDTLSGTTDIPVKPDIKNYNGFTPPSQQTVSIRADGTAVIDYYYTRNKYAVALTKGKGVTSVSGEGDYLYGESVIIDAVVADGYTWSSWSGEHNSVTKTYNFRMPSRNVEDTANAAATEYPITYNLAGGTTQGNPDKYTIEHEAITLNMPERVGYTFLGWTGSNGEIPELSVIIDKGSTGARAYKANWNVNNYSIIFNSNGGSGSMPNLSMTYNVVKNLTSNQFTKQWYTFTGWNTKQDGTGTTYADGASVKNLTAANGATVTLYAQWEWTGAYAAVYGGDTLVFGAGKVAPATYSGKSLTASWQNVDKLEASFNEETNEVIGVPWLENYELAITEVAVADEIKPINTSYWFYNMNNVANINVEKLNTSNVTSMRSMFSSTGSEVSEFTISGLND